MFGAKFEYDRINKTLIFQNPTTEITAGNLRGFKNASDVRTVYINSEVTSIGGNAFAEFLKLKYIFFENGSALQRISEKAFSGTAIEEVQIPPNVSEIGKCAFDNCRSLKKVTILSSYLNSIGKCAFARTIIEQISFPNPITEIEDGAFSNCCNLKSVTFGKDLIKIGADAFNGTGLTNLTIPDSVTEIGEFAFCGCAQLQDVSLGRNITKIHQYTFAETAIKEIDLSNVMAIEECAFIDCVSLCRIALNPSISKIGRNAFSGCNLQKIDIPDTVMNIEDFAFFGNKELRELELSKNLQKIGSFAFSSTAVSSVKFSDMLSHIEIGAFVNCTSLDYVMFGKGLRTIGDRAFENTAISQLEIPNRVTEIGSKAFFKCEKLQDITIGSEIRKIGEQAFDQTALKNVRLSKNCKYSETSFPIDCTIELVDMGITIDENNAQQTVDEQDLNKASMSQGVVYREHMKYVDPTDISDVELANITVPLQEAQVEYENTQYTEEETSAETWSNQEQEETQQQAEIVEQPTEIAEQIETQAQTEPLDEEIYQEQTEYDYQISEQPETYQYETEQPIANDDNYQQEEYQWVAENLPITNAYITEPFEQDGQIYLESTEYTEPKMKYFIKWNSKALLRNANATYYDRRQTVIIVAPKSIKKPPKLEHKRAIPYGTAQKAKQTADNHIEKEFEEMEKYMLQDSEEWLRKHNSKKSEMRELTKKTFDELVQSNFDKLNFDPTDDGDIVDIFKETNLLDISDQDLIQNMDNEKPRHYEAIMEEDALSEIANDIYYKMREDIDDDFECIYSDIMKDVDIHSADIYSDLKNTYRRPIYGND